MKHTPTPWKEEINEPYGAAIFDAKGNFIVTVKTMLFSSVLGKKPKPLPFAATAKLIVKRVNLHEELVEACDIALTTMGGWYSHCPDSHMDKDKAVIALTKVLAKARGEASNV